MANIVEYKLSGPVVNASNSIGIVVHWVRLGIVLSCLQLGIAKITVSSFNIRVEMQMLISQDSHSHELII